jgi:hypothetical protein
VTENLHGFIDSLQIQHLLNSSLNDTPRESIDMDEVSNGSALSDERPTRLSDYCNPRVAFPASKYEKASKACLPVEQLVKLGGSVSLCQKEAVHNRPCKSSTLCATFDCGHGRGQS